MYLLVIVSLVIGMIGLYAQVLSLQAARIASSQTYLAMEMKTWHDAAVSMGASIVDTGNFPISSPACSLGYLPPSAWGLTTICPSPTNNGTIINKDTVNFVNPLTGIGTVTNVSATPPPLNSICTGTCPVGAPNELVHLPQNFNTSAYQFYSVLYRDVNNQPYVLTFVPKPTPSVTNPAPGFITLLPSGSLSSYTIGDLVHQLMVSGMPPYSYGTVQGDSLVTTGFSFSLATAGLTPGTINGAVGIISSTAGH